MLRSSSLDQTSNHLLYYIGVLYLYGLNGYEKNKGKAMKYFTTSANRIECNIHNRVEYYGALRSMTSIGEIFMNEKQYSQATEWFLKSAELGDRSAMCFLGCIYSGNNVETDHKKAIDCYLKSAELGDSDAMFNIGILYQNGEDVEKDYKKAMEWFLKSAELGDSDAIFNIGIWYQNGEGVAKDYKKAMEWFLKSAELDNNEAILEIGRLYHNGFGVEKDLSKACLKSAKLNHEDSMEELSDIYMVQNNYLESSIWLDRYDNYQVKEYTLIENPVENFGRHIIQLDDNVFHVENCDDSVGFIIRLTEGDMKVNGQLLNKIPFFKAMMNENWMKIHEEEDGITILGLKSIQSDGETPLEMNLLDVYFKMKQDESTTSHPDAHRHGFNFSIWPSTLLIHIS